MLRQGVCRLYNKLLANKRFDLRDKTMRNWRAQILSYLLFLLLNHCTSDNSLVCKIGWLKLVLKKTDKQSMQGNTKDMSMKPCRISYRDIVDPKIEVLVSSFGGVMPTALIEWIGKYKSTNECYNQDSLKHALYPPVGTNPNLHLVYIFDDPVLSPLSLFMRQSSRINKRVHSHFVAGHYLSLIHI